MCLKSAITIFFCSSLPQRKHESSVLLVHLGESLVTYGFPSQRASNAEIVSMILMSGWRQPHMLTSFDLLPSLLLSDFFLAHHPLQPSWTSESWSVRGGKLLSGVPSQDQTGEEHVVAEDELIPTMLYGIHNRMWYYYIMVSFIINPHSRLVRASYGVPFVIQIQFILPINHCGDYAISHIIGPHFNDSCRCF